MLIRPSQCTGRIIAPASKSQTLRAIYFALLANGTSYINNYLVAEDTEAMIDSIIKLGARVDVQNDQLKISSSGKLPHEPLGDIHAGNSGIVYRFMTALCSLLPGTSTITGDASIRERRPIAPLLQALEQLGVQTKTANVYGHAPIQVKGPLQQGITQIEGPDSQPISSLIYAAAFASGPTEINIVNLHEKPWIHLSLSWLDKLGIPYQFNGDQCILQGKSIINPFYYTVPGDFSSISNFIALAVIQKSSITISNLQFSDLQGDKVLIDLLKKMGANIKVDQEQMTLSVYPSNQLTGIDIDMDLCIDLLPILAVIGTFAEGQMKLYNAEIAQQKECNRIQSIADELSKMGANIERYPDGLIIKNSPLNGSKVESHKDHRIAMALTIAALCSQGKTELVGEEAVKKTYPHFFQELSQLGADLESNSNRL